MLHFILNEKLPGIFYFYLSDHCIKAKRQSKMVKILKKRWPGTASLLYLIYIENQNVEKKLMEMLFVNYTFLNTKDTHK